MGKAELEISPKPKKRTSKVYCLELMYSTYNIAHEMYGNMKS